MVNKVTFAGFRGGDFPPMDPLLVLSYVATSRTSIVWNISFLTSTLSMALTGKRGCS